MFPSGINASFLQENSLTASIYSPNFKRFLPSLRCMFSFTKTKTNPGWMAISLLKEGICFAHVIRHAGARPQVERIGFHSCSPESVPATLEKISKEHGLHRYQCTTLLGPGEYQILSVDAPNVPREELKAAIRWRIKDMLDFHIDDATIDVLDVPVDPNAPARNHSMFAVVARNSVIRERQERFEAARVGLKAIDIPEMAQRNISALLEQEGRGTAVLSFEEGGGLLTVTYQGELYLARRVDLPFAQLSTEDAERRHAAFERVTLELQRSLDHFDRQYHFITVSRLVLGPLPAVLESLEAYLSSNLYLPVESMSLAGLLNLDRVPELADAALQQRYLATLGAALRFEEKVL